MKSDKDKIRKQYIKLRNDMTKEDVIAKSKVIFEKIIKLQEFINADNIMCYCDFKNEVSTKELIRHCFRMDKKVYLPYIQDDRILPIQIYENTVLHKGYCNILEPIYDTTNTVNIQDISVIIVPGVAFDLNKNRIGFGAGFYDRFLEGVNNNCYKIGIAYDFQVAPQIPSFPYDIKMDVIITENRIIS